MALDLPEAHGRALESTRRYVAQVETGQWGDPTPDEEWTVRDLVNHIVEGNYWVPPLGPELVEACWAVVEPRRDLLAGSGACGKGVALPPGAGRQVQLLAVRGRKE